MATDVMPNTEPSMTKLVGGIIDDTQRLLKQQVDLVKADISREIKDAKEAASSMALAGALLSVGGLLLAFMLVHLLDWAFPNLTLWPATGSSAACSPPRVESCSTLAGRNWTNSPRPANRRSRG